MWYVLVTALGLFLIFEGLLPFVAPDFWRKMVRRMAKQSNRALHISGFICLALGIALFYISHHYLIL
jgi:uncharacterized protein